MTLRLAFECEAGHEGAVSSRTAPTRICVWRMGGGGESKWHSDRYWPWKQGRVVDVEHCATDARFTFECEREVVRWPCLANKASVMGPKTATRTCNHDPRGYAWPCYSLRSSWYWSRHPSAYEEHESRMKIFGLVISCELTVNDGYCTWYLM